MKKLSKVFILILIILATLTSCSPMRNIDKVAKFYEEEGYLCIKMTGVEEFLEDFGFDNNDDFDFKASDVKYILIVADDAAYKYENSKSFAVFMYFNKAKSAEEYAEYIVDEITEEEKYIRWGKVVCYGDKDIINELV